jgi:AsmA protein
MSDLFVRAPLSPRLAAPPPPKRRGGAVRFLLLVAVASALGIGAWVVVTGPASPEHLKSALERGISRATGRRFSIAGPVHVTLGLSPAITAEGITLANIPGGSRPNMLTAKSLSATIALLPLLAGDIVIDKISLQQPDIILETAADGTPNWEMHKIRRALYEATPEPSDTHDSSSAVEIHHLHMAGGTITYRPPVGGALTAQIDTLGLWSDGAAGQLHGTMAGQADGVSFSVTLQAGSFERLEGGAVAALAGAWPLTITLQGPGASFKLDGGVNHPDEMRGYSFLLTGNVQDLVPLYPWLPKPLNLPLHDLNFTGRLSDGANGERHTSGISLQAGPSDLTAAVPGLVLKEAVLSAPGPGQQMQLTVDGQFQGAPLRLSGTATQPDTIAANTPIPVAISGQAASATLSLRGTVPSSWNGLGFDLQASLHVPNLADLSPLARRTLPEVKDVAFDAHVGDAGFKMRGFNLRDLTLTSSLGDLAGNVTAAWSPVPTLSGALSSKHMDVDGVIAALNTLQPPQPGEAAPPPVSEAPPVAPILPGLPGPEVPPSHVIPDTKLPFDVLHDADANLTLSADRLVWGGDTYRDLQAVLSAQSGKVILNPFRVTAPQGAIIGGITLDASLSPPPVAFNLRAPSMSAAKLAAALGFAGGASGQVQIDAQLTGEGDTPHALAASASGHVGLTMVNGQFTDALFQNVFGSALNTAGVPPLAGSSDVRCLALRADLSHGQGRIDALALDTSRLALTGTGSFDLDAETADLHLKPVVRIGGTGVAAPVSLTGGFLELKAAADPVMGGGRYGLTIGGPAPDDGACVADLAVARGGMPGPLPTVQAQASGPRKKPIDLLRGLFH